MVFISSNLQINKTLPLFLSVIHLLPKTCFPDFQKALSAKAVPSTDGFDRQVFALQPMHHVDESNQDQICLFAFACDL
jgi:hypothetical protein